MRPGAVLATRNTPGAAAPAGGPALIALFAVQPGSIEALRRICSARAAGQGRRSRGAGTPPWSSERLGHALQQKNRKPTSDRAVGSPAGPLGGAFPAMGALRALLLACCLAVAAQAAAPPAELCDALGGPRKRCGECKVRQAPPAPLRTMAAAPATTSLWQQHCLALQQQMHKYKLGAYFWDIRSAAARPRCPLTAIPRCAARRRH